jgi:hypothetical protein
MANSHTVTEVTKLAILTVPHIVPQSGRHSEKAGDVGCVTPGRV